MLGPTLTYQHEWWDDLSAILEFTAQLDGLTLHGIDMIRWDEDGKVVEFTVMVRPYNGLTKLMELMAAQLSGARRSSSTHLDMGSASRHIPRHGQMSPLHS